MSLAHILTIYVFKYICIYMFMIIGVSGNTEIPLQIVCVTQFIK